MHDNIFWYEACGLAKATAPKLFSVLRKYTKAKKITHTAEI